MHLNISGRSQPAQAAAAEEQEMCITYVSLFTLSIAFLLCKTDNTTSTKDEQSEKSVEKFEKCKISALSFSCKI